MNPEWPKLDPITGRKICASCFNGIHYHELHSRKNYQGKMENYWVACERLTGKAEHACDGECDCVHRSEENFAAIERQKARQNTLEKRSLLREQLEDPSNPLVAQNESFKPKGKKEHA